MTFLCSYGAACSEVEIDCLTGDMTVLRTDIVMDVGESLNPAIDIGQVSTIHSFWYWFFCYLKISFSVSCWFTNCNHIQIQIERFLGFHVSDWRSFYSRNGTLHFGRSCDLFWYFLHLNNSKLLCSYLWHFVLLMFLLEDGRMFTKGPSTYKLPGFKDIPLQFNIHLLKDAPNPFCVHSSKGTLFCLQIVSTQNENLKFNVFRNRWASTLLSFFGILCHKKRNCCCTVWFIRKTINNHHNIHNNKHNYSCDLITKKRWCFLFNLDWPQRISSGRMLDTKNGFRFRLQRRVRKSECLAKITLQSNSIQHYCLINIKELSIQNVFH